MTDTVCTSSDEEEILTYKLKIHDAEISDTGKWLCEVKDKYGSVSASCDVNIYEEAKKKSVTSDSQVKAIQNGTSANGTNSDSEEEILTYRLKIHDANISDAGKWKCEVKDKYGSTSTSCSLDVFESTPIQEEPRFLMTLRNVTALEGESIKLICRVKGTPLPKIVWYKDDVPISKDDYSYQVLYLKDGTISLEIFYPKPDKDAAVFRCEAENDKGVATSESKVTVLPRKREESLSKDHLLSFSRYSRARSETRRESSESRTSNRAASEARNTSSLSLSTSTRKIEDYYLSSKSRKTTSSHEHLDMYDIYKPGYTPLKFLNPHEMEPEMKLKVRFGTDEEFYFQENLKNKCIMEGSRLYLSAYVIGKLPIYVQWYKDGKVLLNNVYERHGIRRRAGFLSLEIPCTELEDTGEYLVDVRNEQGRMNSSSYIQIEPRFKQKIEYEKPTFLEGIHHVHVNEGQSATFQVIARGNPKPGIIWYKDGKRIQMTEKITIHNGRKGGSILVIHNCDFSDIGLYKVEAHNFAGRCYGSAKLTVFESGTRFCCGDNGEIKILKRRCSVDSEEHIHEEVSILNAETRISNIDQELSSRVTNYAKIEETTLSIRSSSHKDTRSELGLDEIEVTSSRIQNKKLTNKEFDNDDVSSKFIVSKANKMADLENSASTCNQSTVEGLLVQNKKTTSINSTTSSETAQVQSSDVQLKKSAYLTGKVEQMESIESSISEVVISQSLTQVTESKRTTTEELSSEVQSLKIGDTVLCSKTDIKQEHLEEKVDINQKTSKVGINGLSSSQETTVVESSIVKMEKEEKTTEPKTGKLQKQLSEERFDSMDVKNNTELTGITKNRKMSNGENSEMSYKVQTMSKEDEVSKTDETVVSYAKEVSEDKASFDEIDKSKEVSASVNGNCQDKLDTVKDLNIITSANETCNKENSSVELSSDMEKSSSKVLSTKAAATEEIMVSSNTTQDIKATGITQEVKSMDTTPKVLASDMTQEAKATNMKQEAKATDMTQELKATNMTQVAKATDMTQELKATNMTQVAKATDMTQELKATDMTQELKATDMTQELKTTDMTQEAKASDMTQEAKATNLTQEAKATDLTKEAKATDLTKEAKATDMTQEAKATDLTKEAKATDMTQEAKATDLTQEVKATDLTKEAKATDMTQEAKATDLTQEAKATDLTQEAKATNMTQKALVTDIAENLSDTNSAFEVNKTKEKTNEEPKETKVSPVSDLKESVDVTFIGKAENFSVTCSADAIDGSEVATADVTKSKTKAGEVDGTSQVIQDRLEISTSEDVSVKTVSVCSEDSDSKDYSSEVSSIDKSNVLEQIEVAFRETVTSDKTKVDSENSEVIIGSQLDNISTKIQETCEMSSVKHDSEISEICLMTPDQMAVDVSEAEIVTEETNVIEERETIYTTPPNIVKILPKLIEIKDGGKLQLECLVSGEPKPKVVWFYNSKKITADMKHISLTSKAEYHNLEILKTDFERDAGIYTIRASNISGDNESHCEVKIDGTIRLKLSAETTLEKKDLKLNSDIIDIEETKRSNVNKKISSDQYDSTTDIVSNKEKTDPKGALNENRKGDMIGIEEKTVQKTPLDENGQKVLTRTGETNLIHSSSIPMTGSEKPVAEHVETKQVADTCLETTHSLLEKEVKAELTGRAYFDVQLHDEYHPMERDENVRLYVKVAGEPLSPAKWLKDGEELESSRRVLVNWDIVTQESTVVFQRFKGVDAGIYECVILTDKGPITTKTVLNLKRLETLRVESNVPLDASDISDIPVILYPIKDTTVYKGQEAYFECAVDKRPNTTVKWYKDGTEITNKKRKYNLNENKGVYTLTVDDVQESDCGSYTFEVTGEKGITAISANIILEAEKNKNIEVGPPKFITKPDSLLGVPIGGTIVLKCSAEANPPAKFKWQKDMVDIMQCPRVVVSVSDPGESTLTISNTTYSDRGMYVCLVRNRLGRVMTRSNLHVGDEFRESERKKTTGTTEKMEESLMEGKKKSTLDMLTEKLEEVDLAGILTNNSLDSAKKAEVEEEKSRKKAEEEIIARKKAEDEEKATKKAVEEEIARKKEDEEKAKKKAEEGETARKKAEDEENARKKAEEEETARKKAEEEKARKKAEEEGIARKKAEEEEKARKKAEEEEIARKKAEEEEIARKKAEEEEIARKKAEEEEKARRKAEEEEFARKKAEEEEKARKKAEEEEIARKKAEEEEKARKKAEEEEIARKKAEEEEFARKKAEEEEKARKKAEEEEIARKKAEEEEIARKKAEEEEKARKKAEEEEIARKKAEEEEFARKKAEEEEKARKKAEEEEIARKKAEEEEFARKKAEEEEKARKKAEEEEIARKKAEEEEIARKKAVEEEIARKKAEEIARKKAEEEEIARKKAEEEEIARKKAEEEEIARKKAEEEEIARKKAEEEEIAIKKAKEEEIARKKAEEEAIARKETEEEESARQKAEEQEMIMKKAKAEEIAMKKAKEEENAKKIAEDLKNAKSISEQQQLVSLTTEKEKRDVTTAEKKGKATDDETGKDENVKPYKKKHRLTFEEAEKLRLDIEAIETNEKASKYEQAIEEEEKVRIVSAGEEVQTEVESKSKSQKEMELTEQTRIAAEIVEKVMVAAEELEKVRRTTEESERSRKCAEEAGSETLTKKQLENDLHGQTLIENSIPSVQSSTENCNTSSSSVQSLCSTAEGTVKLTSNRKDEIDGSVVSKMTDLSLSHFIRNKDVNVETTVTGKLSEIDLCSVSQVDSAQQDVASQIRHQLKKQLSVGGRSCEIIEVSTERVSRMKGETTTVQHGIGHHHVHHPPEIIVHPNSKRVAAHSELEITVRVRASKHAKVSWVHDGEPVNFKGQEHYELITEEEPLPGKDNL